MKNKLSFKVTGSDLTNLPLGLGRWFVHGSNTPGLVAGPSQNASCEQGNTQPTPESDISASMSLWQALYTDFSVDNYVERAINACGPETQNLLQERPCTETIDETPDEGYCDTSGMEGTLSVIGTLSNVRIYADKGT